MGVRLAGVADPAHEPGADRALADPACGKRALHPAHPAAEPPDVLGDEPPVRREDPVAQEPDSLGAWEDHALVAVDLKNFRTSAFKTYRWRV